MSIALALLALHVALGLAVHQKPALGIDRDAFDLLRHLRTHTLVDVVRVFTNLAAFPVAAAVVLLAAFAAHRAGHGADAVRLIAGMTVLVILVSLTKELWDRPRPAHRLQGVHGLSYPSGHSAYAVAWIAAATTARSRNLIIAASGLAVAIGLSRLYLHVHYLTDVLGGAALAGAVFVTSLRRR